MSIAAQHNTIPGFVKWIIFASFIFMPIFLILPFFFWGNTDPSIGLSEENLIATRLQPVGQLNLKSADVSDDSEMAANETVAVAFDPQATYDSICAACHATTALGAPVFGETADWQARLDAAGSVEGIVEIGIAGKGTMPPKGGASISDEQFHEMVVFMLDHSGIAVQ